jgi:pyridoxine 5'-phosphate synthase
MIELGVNIDHVATVREARKGHEPDPVWAAVEAHLGGADGITVHLREDRRHIQDHDVRRLRELTHIKLNLEMAATDEMVGIACALKPEMAMLVPEGRHEITTEGGLDVAGQEARLRDVVARRARRRHRDQRFIDAELPQVEAAASIGVRVCEIHTGPYAHAFFNQGRDRKPGRAHRAGKDPQGRRRDPRRRHALQRRPCAELLQRAARRRAARHPRTAHRPRHRQPRHLRRHARSRRRDEAPDARGAVRMKAAMIYGIGTDIVAVKRMADYFQRHGERGLEKMLAPGRTRGLSRQPRSRRASWPSASPPRRRWARRSAPACARPVLLPDIAVEHDELGKPFVQLLVRGWPPMFAERGLTAHLSISDEQDYAVAFVILEKP